MRHVPSSFPQSGVHRPHPFADPRVTGIGLRGPHIRDLLSATPAVGFVEVHSENYFGGGAKLKRLTEVAHHYPLSFHGVGLSLGRADGLDADHLRQLRGLCQRFEPLMVSEHLSFSAFGGVHVPDLLPVPLTDEALIVFCDHIDEMQTALGRQVLIENPSRYMAFAESEWPEGAFLSALAQRTGCGLLLDINNIYVSAHNLGLDPAAYFESLTAIAAVQEYHLAGHARDDDHLIDTHGDRVSPDVWALFQQALSLIGDRPTLIEWDTDLPALDILVAEARTADGYRTVQRVASQNAAAQRLVADV